jgi:CheY-like chemotaxis protein
MPDLNGFETAALIRERQRTRETSIIFVTAIHRTRRPPSHPLRTPLHLSPANLRRPDGSRLLLSVDAHPEQLADRHQDALAGHLPYAASPGTAARSPVNPSV